MLKIGVLFRWRGNNLRHIHQWCQEKKILGEVVGIISNHEEAPGFVWAQENQVPSRHVVFTKARQQQAEEEIDSQLRQWEVDFVVLAGFLRIFSQDFLDRWPDRVVNLHPSLLPDYKGLNPHIRVLQDKQKRHGCSVHVATQDLDSGPVIGQGVVEVLDDDTEESLVARVQEAEFRLLPKILAMVSRQEIEIRDCAVYHNGKRLSSPLLLDQLEK